MFFRRIRVLFFGIKRYSGSPESICRQIIESCYDHEKRYFRVSAGHFCEFYCRDFGWCAESLVKLGYKKQVISTLAYALSIFEKHGRIEQIISPGGKAFTFPQVYSPDALAFIVRSLKVAGDKSLVERYRFFLEKESLRYFDAVIDKNTGLVRKDCHFSSMKDYSVRSSSCYDNVMTAMLREDLAFLGLANPFKKYDYASLLKKHFWTGSYFLDDLSGGKDVCGGANTLPFWSGIIHDPVMRKSALASVMKEDLNKPFPLKYASSREKAHKMIRLEVFAGDYERDAVWAHIGMMFIAVAAKTDKKIAVGYLNAYRKLVLEHKNFLEVFDRRGKPFKTALYYSDESMLWAANYLLLEKELA
ncbi:hypothetical protein JW826_04985 [Candidatus Woesearchaeota archaeon]|nr:hypothetical protein [Candidatus Woesearchaeota archaeon]